MNIFHIPSWYMSPTSPLTGIFFRDQAIAVAKSVTGVNAGISTWGQNDDNLLLNARDHIFNLPKIINGLGKTTADEILLPNAVQYFTPAFTFTRKILNGNIKGIFKANVTNLKRFEDQFGKTDLIHAHCAYPGAYIAMMLKEKFSIPYVITEQMSPFPFPSFLNYEGECNDFVKKAYAHADRVIAVSPALAEKISSLKLGNPITIFNPVDENFFVPVKIPVHERFCFFTLGRLEHQKGIDILLKAISKVIQVNSNLEFVVGGSGSEFYNLTMQAEKLGIAKHVTWLGQLSREQARQQFQRCDAFVLPSRHESQGIVYTEAMACGKPSIGTICGGPEFLINEKNGMLVRPENVAELSRAMLWMLENHKRYNPEQIRKDFVERFSIKAFVSQLLPVYESILKRNF